MSLHMFSFSLRGISSCQEQRVAIKSEQTGETGENKQESLGKLGVMLDVNLAVVIVCELV